MPKKKQAAPQATPEKHHTPPAAPQAAGNWQPFYRTDQAAEALGLAEATIRKYTSQGHLKAHRRGGRLYFLHSDLVDFITGQ